MDRNKVWNIRPWVIAALACACVPRPQAVLAAGAAHPTEVCSIVFDQSKIKPAMVPDDAAGCLHQAAQALAASPHSILVIISTADRAKDDNPANGHTRMVEDTTGEDIRYWDVASYRAINTKDYLVRWDGAPASRIAPRTAYTMSQTTTLYLLPAGTNIKAVLPHTVPIFEAPCTMKPCAKPDEEFMHAQPRGKIPGA